MLKIYTKNNCVFCDMMKTKLDLWGYEYEVINIQENEEAKAFIVLDEGHKTVPQLYYKNINVNRGVNTDEFTKSILEEAMKYAA
jgi:glutaredoxin